ncbi:PF20097 family protein [Sphingomonas sp. LB-2]|nr:PF20097 family protein [Sphingomonas caeni]
MRSNDCPRCQGSMTEGFIPDHTDSAVRKVAIWVEGAPEKSRWTGVKLGKKTRYEIQTWRCGRCGFLESYAKG